MTQLFFPVAPDTINNHVKTCREEQKNLHFFAPEYGGTRVYPGNAVTIRGLPCVILCGHTSAAAFIVISDDTACNPIWTAHNPHCLILTMSSFRRVCEMNTVCAVSYHPIFLFPLQFSFQARSE